MKYSLFTLSLVFSLFNCTNKETRISNKLVGTWQLVYAETIEKDSLKIKDLSHTTFVKIINPSHFSFFNQDRNNTENFYGGAGTYTLEGNDYLETLTFTSTDAIRNHQFPFTVEFKGDTLIQSGLEEIKEAGIKRNIIEKYMRIN